MKNLRKLSRESLKKLNGGKLYPGDSGGGGCDDMCMPNGGNGGDGCSQYGLTCGMFQCSPGGKLGFRCQ